MKRSAITVVAALLSVFLAGCGEPTLSANTPESFRDSYEEVRGRLSASDREEFEIAVRKLAAFAAFDPAKLDFSGGVPETDFAAVLPKDFSAFQSAAFRRIAHQIDGRTGTEVIGAAEAAQSDVVAKYQAAVDMEISSARRRVDAVMAEQRRKAAVLSRISVISASLTQETFSGGSQVPTLTFEVHNNTAAALERLDLRAVIGEDGDPDAFSDGFAVEFGSSPMTSGEIRRIRLRMGGMTWSSGALANARRLPVTLSVLRYRDVSGNILDATAPELAELTRKLDLLIGHRAQAAAAIDSSFRTR